MRHYFVLIFLIVSLFLTYTPAASAEEISLARVMQQAIAHAYDLRLADVDIEISRQRLKESRSAYFPTLNLRYTNEWFDDLTDGNGDWDSVGGSVISATGSKWKNVLGVSLQYNLYDFGARGRLYDNARRDVAIARLTRRQEEINLRLQLLDLYSQGLKAQVELAGQKLARAMRQEIFRLSQRLHKAGSLDRIQMGEAAIGVAESNQRVDELTMSRVEVLHHLSVLSGERYDDQLDRLIPLPVVHEVEQLNVTDFPEIQAYELAIRKKQEEYKITTNSYLPRLSFYSSYSFYGSDSASWPEAFEEIKETNWACGVMFDLNIFNGLADQAKAARLKAEVQRLKLEREKKIAEHESDYHTLRHHARLFAQHKKQYNEMDNYLRNQSVMAERLATEQVRGRLAILNQQVSIKAKELQAELQEIDRRTALLRLQILTEGQFGKDGLALMAVPASSRNCQGIGDSYD